MKIKFALLPTLVTLALVLSGCSGDTSPADGTTAPVETAAPVTEAQPTAVLLTEGGKPGFTLVRSDLAGENMISLVQQTAKNLQSESELSFPIATDWVKRGTEPDSSAREILFGTTNRPETLAVAKRVGYDGYAVAVEGNKIVVYGSTYSAQKKAADAFCDALAKHESGELVLDLPAGGITEAGDASFFADGDASDYVIVAGEADNELALNLRNAIRKAYGYELTINRPTAAETAREIIIGNSGRAASNAVLANLTSPVGYQVKVDGEKILLAGKSSFGTTQAVEYFLQNYVRNEYSVLFQIPKDVEYGYVGLADAEYVELTGDADIRIMSYNILTELWNDKLPVEGRDEIVAATLLTYMPDVIGWQEVSDKWYTRLVPMVKEQYTFVNQKTAEGKTNYSGMAYNKEKVTLIKTGCELFSKGNSGNMRLMNWAVFETIAGGERFAVINTHLDINRTDGSPKNAYRLVQAKEMGEKVLALQKEYNCPVIITGDYNCSRSTEEYKLFVETGKVKDAQWTSVNAVNNTYKTYHDVGSVAGAGDTSIDHITYTEGAEALFYMNHIGPPICDASDHNPIMADFKLN